MLVAVNAVQHARYVTWMKMSKYVVICQVDECEAGNEDYEDDGSTYWFTCSTCGYDNEVVHSHWK